ncbi:hypothetical protein [Streptomyces sp. PH10-H1]|uniref:hypothetical protein n=1 Tax=Streptomyces sp. PH10-H1 TaxID=3046212 RepID=UPI0024B95383|nr:hypothetical protein [Streptomyces sp. PH10-H1]MDJ0346752.1 hypothetical protein [Streptomyces sp. PH10-H1]
MSITLSAPVNGAAVIQADESLRRARMTQARLSAVPQPAAGRPEHFPWCLDCIPSTNTSPNRLAMDHTSATLYLPVPDGLEFEGDESLMDACLTLDEGFVGDQPEISFGCGGNGVFLDAEAARKMLASLEAFTAGFKTMVEQLPAERQS